MNNSHNKKIQHDVDVLANFIHIFCRENHKDREKFPVTPGGVTGLYLKNFGHSLCEECGKLLMHGASKRIICPMDPKPSCKNCEKHCYAPGYRESIQKVMRFSGAYLIKHGRVDLMLKYFS